MVRRSTRTKEFSEVHRLQILAQLECTRSFLCQMHAKVKPFGPDYNLLSKVNAVIDEVATEWTDDATYYHEKPHGRGVG